MFVSAKERIGPWKKVSLVRDGLTVPQAYAADTEGRWYEEYIRGDDGKFVIENRSLATRRIENVGFDLVDKETGVVVAESR